MSDRLAAEQVAELEALVGVCPEINPLNYDHNDVLALNDWASDVAVSLPSLLAAAKREAEQAKTRANAFADLPGVGRVSHADAHDMAIRFIRRHFDGDRCEKMPLTSIPADPSRDHDIRLLAYIEQQASVEAEQAAEIERLRAALTRIVNRGPCGDDSCGTCLCGECHVYHIARTALGKEERT